MLQDILSAGLSISSSRTPFPRYRAPLLLLVICLAVLAACDSEDGTDASQADDEQPQDDASPTEPQDIQELAVGLGGDELNLEGPHASLAVTNPRTNVFESLLHLTPDYEIESQLAEDVTFVEPDTWRFTLREDVSFHNGEPVTAEAVANGLFDRIAEAGGHTVKGGPDSIEVVDEHTFDFTPTLANARVPQQIVHGSYPVFDPATQIGEHPTGTGPFQFVEYQPDERLVVERNPDYWGDPPALDRITFRFYADASARRLALEAGDIDVALELPLSDAERLSQDGYEVAVSPPASYLVLFPNRTEENLLQEQAVREAVATAIDRDSLVQDLLAGFGTTEQTFVAPGLLGSFADNIVGQEKNTEHAEELLEEAGWTNQEDGIRDRQGESLTLTLVSGYPSAEVHRGIPEFIQSELGQVGIDVDIVETPDAATFRDRITEGQGDLFLELRSQNDADPAFLPTVFLSDVEEGGAEPYQDLFGPSDNVNGPLRESLDEPESETVQSLVAEAMAALIDDEVGVIQLASVPEVYVMREEVEGLEPHPARSSLRWDNVSLEP